MMLEFKSCDTNQWCSKRNNIVFWILPAGLLRVTVCFVIARVVQSVIAMHLRLL